MRAFENTSSKSKQPPAKESFIRPPGVGYKTITGVSSETRREIKTHTTKTKAYYQSAGLFARPAEWWTGARLIRSALWIDSSW
jgi:hypothetical protein